jgi:hypothetical protein
MMKSAHREAHEMFDVLFWASSLGILGFAAYRAVFRREGSLLFLAIVFLGIIIPFLVAGGIVSPPWVTKVVARGEGHEGAIVFLLYLAMLAGMLAHFAYGYFVLPKNKRRKFDLGNFLAPVLVSPIVFLPLASIFETSEPVAGSSPRLMLLLIAFENGFFWREFFENRQKARVAGGDA